MVALMVYFHSFRKIKVTVNKSPCAVLESYNFRSLCEVAKQMSFFSVLCCDGSIDGNFLFLLLFWNLIELDSSEYRLLESRMQQFYLKTFSLFLFL